MKGKAEFVRYLEDELGALRMLLSRFEGGHLQTGEREPGRPWTDTTERDAVLLRSQIKGVEKVLREVSEA